MLLMLLLVHHLLLLLHHRGRGRGGVLLHRQPLLLLLVLHPQLLLLLKLLLLLLLLLLGQICTSGCGRHHLGSYSLSRLVFRPRCLSLSLLVGNRSVGCGGIGGERKSEGAGDLTWSKPRLERERREREELKVGLDDYRRLGGRDLVRATLHNPISF